MFESDEKFRQWVCERMPRRTKGRRPPRMFRESWMFGTWMGMIRAAGPDGLTLRTIVNALGRDSPGVSVQDVHRNSGLLLEIAAPLLRNARLVRPVPLPEGDGPSARRGRGRPTSMGRDRALYDVATLVDVPRPRDLREIVRIAVVCAEVLETYRAPVTPIDHEMVEHLFGTSRGPRMLEELTRRRLAPRREPRHPAPGRNAESNDQQEQPHPRRPISRLGRDNGNRSTTDRERAVRAGALTEAELAAWDIVVRTSRATLAAYDCLYPRRDDPVSD